MSNDSRWKRILGRETKSTVEVEVDGKPEIMTSTQAYRFDELKSGDAQASPAAGGNPLEDLRYTLDEAAFRLMTSPDALLERAASGALRLYTGVAGLTGRWRRIDDHGESTDSSIRTLESGYLALPLAACKELAADGVTQVSAFDLPELAYLSDLAIDAGALAELAAWGRGQKRFRIDEPLRIAADQVVLLAPLAG